MDVVVPSIWLSSFAGALLFYAGGWLSPRPGAAPDAPGAPGAPALPPSEPTEPHLALAAPSAEIEAERAARARAEEQARGAVRARDEAVAALTTERARSTALREDLRGERDARSRADAEAARDRKRLVDDAGRLQAQASEVAEHLATLRARVESDGGEVGRTRAQLGAAEARAAAAEVRGAALGADLSRRRAPSLAGGGRS